MRLMCPVYEWARRTPAAPALVFAGQRWSYSELDAGVARWQDLLRARGVGRGDRVAVLSHSHPSWVQLFYALGRIGALAAPLNARLTAAELVPLIAQVQPRLSFAQEALRERLPGAQVLEQVSLGEGSARSETPLLDPGAERLILFTSGTTGRAKGAVLTEANFQASAESSRGRLGASPAPPRWLGTLPLFHVGGLAMLTRCFIDGGCLILQDRFEPAEANHAIDTERITHASFVPTTLERLLDARRDRPMPSTFEAALIGGGPVPAALLARARALGLKALQTYGLTEACSQVCTESPDSADGTTAGTPMPGTEIRVVSESAGERVGPGHEGLVEVRGPTVMKGYLDQPEATRAAFHDGWFRTGDIGVTDGQGRLRILSRRSDLIVSGGENIYPAEVEAVLAHHPAIAEVAVTGLPDEHWGQVPVGVLVPRGSALELGTLATWCRERLAGFKVPRRFVVVETLPRTALGKVDRVRLLELARGA